MKRTRCCAWGASRRWERCRWVLLVQVLDFPASVAAVAAVASRRARPSRFPAPDPPDCHPQLPHSPRDQIRCLRLQQRYEEPPSFQAPPQLRRAPSSRRARQRHKIAGNCVFRSSMPKLARVYVHGPSPCGVWGRFGVYGRCKVTPDQLSSALLTD